MSLPRLPILVLFVLLFSVPTVAAAQGNDKEALSPCSEVLLLINDDYYKILMRHIREAKKEILIAAYIFKTSPRPGMPGTIVDALAAAAKRGVMVRVLLEKSNNKKDSLDEYNKITAQRLLRYNIPICFDSPKKTTHSKLVVIDGRYVFIGSHNLTTSGLSRNNEVSVCIDSPILALSAKKYIQSACYYAVRN